MEKQTPTSLWWFLLREGGMHSAAEIEAGLGNVEPGANVSKSLLDLTQNGYVFRRKGPSGVWVYGVSLACKVPRGLTLRDLYQPLTGQALPVGA